MSEEKELPEGWIQTILEDVTAPIRISAQPQEVTTLRYIGLEHIEAQTMRLIGTALANELKSSMSRFGPGDVLYGRLRPYLNKVFRPDFEGVCSPEFLVFRESPYLNSRYLQYFLNSWRFKEFAAHLVEGDRPRIDWGQLKCFNFPLPPRQQQQRIVSAIEERFTILDAVTTALQQDKQKLKLARASVLKHAVEGKLTEKWRAEHPATESGQQLLERILTERRAKWEAEQLAKGKDPKKLRYEEPKGPDVSELPELPEEWCWVSLDQLITYLRNGLSDKPNTEPPGHRILRINAVRPMSVDLDEIRFLDLPEKDIEAYFIEDGDILFTRYNGSLDLLGVAGMVRGCIQPTLHPDKLIRVKVQFNGIDPSYVQLASNVGFSRTHIENRARTTAGQTGISGSDLKQMPIPLPSTIEQQQIVSEVERRLSVIEQAEVAIETSLKRIERARQSILERAFSGRLVPQDPHDEPASVLLERIQEERAKRLAEGKLRGKNGGIKTVRGKKTKEEEFIPQWQLLRDAQPSGAAVDGLLSDAGAYEDGAAEKCPVEQEELNKEELGDLVQMPLLSLWD